MSTPTTNNLEMTENSPYILNTNNPENEIQSSAFLHRPNSNDDDDISNNLDNNDDDDMITEIPSRRPSKIRFYGEKEKGYYSGNMERFFQSEVRPVYFGTTHDNFIFV